MVSGRRTVQLPANVRRIIDEQAEAVGFSALQRAATAMSEAYREGRAAPAHLTASERTAAYLATRMPATYAAAHAVLREVASRAPAITSVLDVGSGTGAASLAAREWFPNAVITMIERDSAFLAAARQWLPNAVAIPVDLGRIPSLPPHDLVIAAYSLGELARPRASALWQAARVALAIIEPGTPKGFAFIRGIRAELLAAGACMLAPCPAAADCPVVDPDWCHFAARVERSSIHRRLKQAELGYEDEKFSYIALAREAVRLPRSRLIRRPRQQPGLITLEVCTPAGLSTEHVTRRDRDAFRAARKAAWGDAGIS
jgi:ribosomal protein RSM22 (predicted rRNA methylase)